jgi:hypothetical protein
MFAADIPQTIKRAYQDMRDGGDPWVAIGDFSHDWYGNYPESDQRAALVAESIELPQEEISPEQFLSLRQWAAFCAASVEYLCEQAGMVTPEWTNDAQYILSEQEAFYTSPLAYKPRVRERLEREAPPAFKRRRIYCSERIYANKYETAPVPIRQSA